MAPAAADDFAPPPSTNTAVLEQQQQATRTFVGGDAMMAAPAVAATNDGLPEGTQWRYSEFIKAVQSGKVGAAPPAPPAGRQALVVQPLWSRAVILGCAAAGRGG